METGRDTVDRIQFICFLFPGLADRGRDAGGKPVSYSGRISGRGEKASDMDQSDWAYKSFVVFVCVYFADADFSGAEGTGVLSGCKVCENQVLSGGITGDFDPE